MTTLSRRALLRGGALGAAGLAGLAGCGTVGTAPAATGTIPPKAPGEVVRLQYWAWLKDLQQVCDVWNAQRPDIQVEAVWIPGGNTGGYQKLFAAIAAGSGPDLAQVEMRNVPSFLLQSGLVDVSRYGFGAVEDRYDRALVEQVTFLDGAWAVPQDSGPMATFYRPDLLEEVGAGPPATWAEWLDTARAVHEADPDRWLESFPVGDTSVFLAYAAQAGAVWFTPEDDRWVVRMTDDATMAVARHFDTAISEGVVNTALAPYSPGWFAAVGDGRIAALTSGSWGDALLEGATGAAGKWRVAPMPVWADLPGSYGSSYLGGSTAALMAGSEHPHEALEFATWMTTSQEGIDAMIQYSGIGWSPATDYIGAARQEGSDFFGGQAYGAEVFAPAAQEQNLDWTWPPIAQQVMDGLGDRFRGVLTGGTTMVDAVAAMEGEVVEIFREKGLSAEVAS
ncbi:extracellular solute-binding protein [uncultured Pseudokineococcus sp.]|uniref:extracellular solute-binding protein n=1 Tax=uncultured Pseudokineococcus sp. TaxID=1642928 RepID=UPI002637DABC|nr:extracellular solute-binding protein [uncultured Pseudokineococcus sp.]